MDILKTRLKRTGHRENGRMKQGEVVEGKIQIELPDGRKKTINKRFRKSKVLPKGTKTPKRICIVCLKNSIHKNDSNYESKICKECM